MSASANPPAFLTRFSTEELDMLAKSADALSAYLGKPVLAEVGVGDEGAEWVTFGIPLDKTPDEDDAKEQPRVQLGGAGARLLGNRGGLPLTEADAYDCLYLWAILIAPAEAERFIKLNQDGEESAWSDALIDMLPFALSDEELPDPDEEDDEDEDDDSEEKDRLNATFPPPGALRH
jgi:hypothetical protein